MKKDFIQTLKILLTAMVLSLGVSYVYAWTAPTDAPPAGNTPAPLNTGLVDQIKTGGLDITATLTANNLLIPGSIGVGTLIPSEKLDVAGNVIATAFLYSSDERLKDNIAPLTNTAEKIQALQGVSFNWEKDGKESIGFIAQDVEKIFPSLVATNPTTGMKSVQYAGIIAPLVETVKEQQKQIDILKAEVEELKTR